jgi:hypothetical protein
MGDQTFGHKPKLLATGVAPLGIIAIGVVPMGVIALGVVPMGVISIGVVGMGLISVAAVNMGVVTAGLTTMGVAWVGLVGMGPIRIDPTNWSIAQHKSESIMFPTKELAEQKAKQMGCNGAHAMGGEWMPCASMDEYGNTHTKTKHKHH